MQVEGDKEVLDAGDDLPHVLLLDGLSHDLDKLLWLPLESIRLPEAEGACKDRLLDKVHVEACRTSEGVLVVSLLLHKIASTSKCVLCTERVILHLCVFE